MAKGKRSVAPAPATTEAPRRRTVEPGPWSDDPLEALTLRLSRIHGVAGLMVKAADDDGCSPDFEEALYLIRSELAAIRLGLERLRTGEAA